MELTSPHTEPQAQDSAAISHEETVQALKDIVLSQSAEEAHKAAQGVQAAPDTRRISKDTSPVRSEVLAEVAKVIPEAAQEALTLATGIYDSEGRYRALGSLGEACLEHGLIEELIEEFEKDKQRNNWSEKDRFGHDYGVLRDSRARREALEKITGACVRAGRAEELLATTDEDPYGYDCVLKQIVIEYGEQGDIENALEYARRIGNIYNRDSSSRDNQTRVEAVAGLVGKAPQHADAIYESARKMMREKGSADWTDTMLALAKANPDVYADKAYTYITRSPNAKYWKYKHLDGFTDLALSLQDEKKAAKIIMVITEQFKKDQERQIGNYSSMDKTAAERDREQMIEVVGKLVRGGKYKAVLPTIDYIDDRYSAPWAKQVVSGLTEIGEPDTALKVALEYITSPHKLLETFNEILPLMTSDQFDEAIAIIDSSSAKDEDKASMVIRIAAKKPELLDIAVTRLEAVMYESDEAKKRDRTSHTYSTNLKTLLNELKNSNRYEEAISVRQQLGLSIPLDTYVHLLPNRPELLGDAVEIAAKSTGHAAKLYAYSQLVAFDPELVTEVRKIIAEDMQLSRSRGSDDERNTVRAALELARLGYVDESLEITRQLTDVYRNNYFYIDVELLPNYPEIIPTILEKISLYGGSTYTGVEKDIQKFVQRLPQDQLLPTLNSLKALDKEWAMQAALIAASPQLIARGQSRDLLTLMPPVPEDLSSSNRYRDPYAAAIKLIAPQLAEAKLYEDLVVMTRSLWYENEKSAILLPFAPDSEVVRAELLNIVDHEDYPVRTLITMLPYEPAAAQRLIEATNKLRIEWSERSGYNDSHRAMFQNALAALAENGYGLEAMAVIQYTRDRLGTNVFMDYLSEIVKDDRAVMSAFTYARKIGTVDRTKAMVIIAQAHQTNTTDLVSHNQELFGVENLVETPHERSDRSINYSLFASDIARDLGLIEPLMITTESPAEIMALLRTVDEAAAMVGEEEAIRIRQAALTLLVSNVDLEQISKNWNLERVYKSQLPKGDKSDNLAGYKYLPNLRQLTNNLGRMKGNGSRLLLSNYTVAQLFEHPWLVSTDVLQMLQSGDKMFPAGENKAAQYEWLADRAYVKLQGFNKRTIGQIIANRLANNIEYSLHDATQWLDSFSVHLPQFTFNEETGEVEELLTNDALAEESLINALLVGEYTAEELRRLPGFASALDEGGELKTQKFEPLFYDPLHTLLYAATIQAMAANPDQKVDIALVRQYVENWHNNGQLDVWVNQSKGTINQPVQNLVEQALSRLNNIPSEDRQINIPETIGRLKEVGKTRKAYIDSTTTWLRNYQNLAGQKLGRVWNERPHALQDGVVDNPSDIYTWSLSSGLRKHITENADASGMLPSGINGRELLERYSLFVPELVTRYSSEKVVQALEKMWREQNLEADLPAYTIDLPNGYSFKIFAKDDPAGMTIGYDTDCCMTLGGASESCIYAGYTDKRAGFAALYDSAGNLLAQSFIWHNDGALVLDNIEAQRGRNVDSIQQSYKTALTTYLAILHRYKPQLQIAQVNLGTGYVDGAITSGLEDARHIAPPFEQYVYTDSQSQKALIAPLNPEELEQAALDTTNQVTAVGLSMAEPQPQVEKTAEIVSIDDIPQTAAMISRLEAQIYPEEIQVGIGSIKSDLARPNNYSFMIYSRAGNGEIVGYCLAYRDSGGVYISDLAILPTEQRNGYGIDAMKYLFEQLNQTSEEVVIFEARETTSYQALTSDTGQKLLEEFGFRIKRSELRQEYFDNGESVYEVRLEKIPARKRELQLAA